MTNLQLKYVEIPRNQCIFCWNFMIQLQQMLTTNRYFLYIITRDRIVCNIKSCKYSCCFGEIIWWIHYLKMNENWPYIILWHLQSERNEKNCYKLTTYLPFSINVLRLPLEWVIRCKLVILEMQNTSSRRKNVKRLLERRKLGLSLSRNAIIIRKFLTWLYSNHPYRQTITISLFLFWRTH